MTKAATRVKIDRGEDARESAADDLLTGPQGVFVAALVGGSTVPEAAAAAEVSERTGRRWLVESVAVRDVVREAVANAIADVSRALARDAMEARDVLVAAMRDPQASPAARVRAATLVLDRALQWRAAGLGELADLLQERRKRHNPWDYGL